MSKRRKMLSLHEDIICLGTKIANNRERDFSNMVSELINEEAIRTGVKLLDLTNNWNN